MSAEQLSESFAVLVPCRPEPEGCRLSELLLVSTGVQLFILAGQYCRDGKTVEMSEVFDRTRQINGVNCVREGGGCPRIAAAQELLVAAVTDGPSRENFI